MQLIGDLIVRLGLFYFFIAFGFLAARIRRMSAPLNRWTTLLLLYIMMPLIIIDTLLTAAPSSFVELAGTILFTFLIHLLGFGLMFARIRSVPIPNKEKGTYLLTVTFNNAIFLPIPLALIFLGEVAIPVIALYSISQMLMLATLGTLMGSVYSENGENRRAMMKKALTFPPLIAVLTAVILLVSGFTIPIEFESIMDTNSLITTYLALFAVGLSLGSPSVLRRNRMAYEAIAIRQIVVPVLIGFLLFFVGLSSLTRNVILLQAMMPPAVFTVIYASGLGLDAESAATVVTLGTILLLPVVPLMPLLFT